MDQEMQLVRIRLKRKEKNKSKKGVRDCKTNESKVKLSQKESKYTPIVQLQSTSVLLLLVPARCLAGIVAPFYSRMFSPQLIRKYCCERITSKLQYYRFH